MIWKKPIAFSLIAFLLVIFVFIGTIFAILVLYLNTPGPLAAERILVFSRGTSLKKISKQLYENGVIDYPKVFWLITRLSGDGRNLKAGEYKFQPHIKPSQVIEIMLEGKVLIRRLTIPEGYTTREIIEEVNNIPVLTGNIVNHYAEGTLMPDTYRYIHGERKQYLLDKMAKKSKEVLDELWQKRAKNLPIKTKHEALILASIVEKEAGYNDDKRRIAAVFINRLDKGMKLQADPTVIYSLTLGKFSLERKLTRKDLKLESLFNTYHISGLPPTPIANPGKEAIKAVLNPLKTNDFYFVVNGEGGHNFSSTLKGHIENIKYYKSKIRNKK